jgi:hypothetical protein
MWMCTKQGCFDRCLTNSTALMACANMCLCSSLQGPKQMKKLKPRVPGSKKKKAAKKARKAVGCNVAPHPTFWQLGCIWQP